jgi:hypothetical protein
MIGTLGWILFLREMTISFVIIMWLSSIASFIIYAINSEPENVCYFKFELNQTKE